MTATTDERGEYRLFGLPAGLYAVQARARIVPAAGATSSIPTALSLPSQYPRPSTVDPDAAAMVSVRPAEERQGIDITIGDAPTASPRHGDGDDRRSAGRLCLSGAWRRRHGQRGHRRWRQVFVHRRAAR